MIGKQLAYDTLEQLRAKMVEANPVFARDHVRLAATDQTGPAGDPAALSAAPFISAIADYYLTNPISRASATMAECSRIYTHGGEIEAPRQAAE